MKKILLLEICFLFLATTFQSDRMIGWVQQTIPRQDLAVMDLQFLDSLNGFAILLHANPDTAFVIKTIDGGLNWMTTKIENTYVSAISFPNISTGYIAARYSPDGVILKTTNSGNNWFTVSVLPYASILRDIFFLNNDTGWVSSNDLLSGGLWHTIDGGYTWQKQLNENYDPTKIFFVNSNTGWVIGNSGQNLYKTTNSGVNWSVQSHTSSENYYDVFFATQDTGWIIKNIGTGNKSLVRSTNGGNNWDSVNAPLMPTESRLYFIGNKYGWAGSGPNKIFASKDGFNWGMQHSPIFGNDNVSFVDTLHGWAGYSGLVHTTDGGGPIVSVNQTGTEVAEEYKLFQNYPNPFNSSTKFKIEIAKLKDIKIIVFDISGRAIKTLVDERMNPGTYDITFDGSKLSSGVYFYTLFADGRRIDTKKLMLIK